MSIKINRDKFNNVPDEIKLALHKEFDNIEKNVSKFTNSSLFYYGFIIGGLVVGGLFYFNILEFTNGIY